MSRLTAVPSILTLSGYFFQHPNSTTCIPLCTQTRACSLHACSLFCASSDVICRDTCQSFTDARTCDDQCEIQPSLVVSDVAGQLAQITVNIELPEGSLAHVVLLEQVTASNALTFDTSHDMNSTFSGLYPWFEYRIQIVVFPTVSCCISGVLWQNKVSYDPTGDGASSVRFFPYPSQLDWITVDQTVNSSTYLYPSAPIYLSDNQGESWWEGIPNDPNMLTSINARDIRVRSANQENLTTWKTCYEGADIKCVYQLGMGYMFEIPSSTQHSVPVYDASSSQIASLAIKPRRTCKYFPNKERNINISMSVECGRTNSTTNSSIVKFNSDKISIKACFMSTKDKRGSIDRTCCDRHMLDCVKNSPTTLNISTDRSYLFYFLYDPDKTGILSTCQWSKSCDGYYERITPWEDINECVPPTGKPPSVSESTLILSTSLPLLFLVVCGVFLYLWRCSLRLHQLTPVSIYIPTDEEALLGGELPRDAISKERYVDRGNFGYIFEGKLKVKIDDTEELTKQYEVALKILKTKVDEIENCAASQENIKDAKKAMKAEINMMKQIQAGRSLNRNVLRMYGYVVDAPPYILVLELCLINLTRYLRQIRIQIDHKTLTADDAQQGTTLEGDTNNVSGRGSKQTLSDQTQSVHSRSGGRESTGDESDNSCSQRRTDNRLLSHSGQENTVILAPPRERMLSRGTAVGSSSGYNDSVHGKMTRQRPCSLEKFQDTVLTTANLLNFCWQVSSGMDFLHSIDLIHRDLAADNVLIKEESDGSLTLKICDFGQSRMLFNGAYVGSGDSVADRQRMFRLRWTAPEIKEDPKTWSKESDVWSYGVFMWEVFTMGGHPYPGWPDHLVIDNLLCGLRMARPTCCCETFWNITEKCWNAKPEMRGQFCDIKFKLDQFMNDEHDRNIGIERSDYIFCDVPLLEEIVHDVIDLSIQDIEGDGNPLDLHLDFHEGMFSDKNGVVIENHVFDGQRSSKVFKDTAGSCQYLKVSLDLAQETVNIQTRS